MTTPSVQEVPRVGASPYAPRAGQPGSPLRGSGPRVERASAVGAEPTVSVNPRTGAVRIAYADRVRSLTDHIGRGTR